MAWCEPARHREGQGRDASVTIDDAIEFLEPAFRDDDDGGGAPRVGTWLDLGAGRGVFTRALASLLGAEGRVIAVDRDASVLRDLEHAAGEDVGGAPITTITADLREMSAMKELEGVELAGALAANALHYVARPEAVLRELAARLLPGGRIVIIEYDRRGASRWIPHPLPSDRLETAALEAGLAAPHLMARRPSRYQGDMYCAVLRVRPGV